MLIDQFQKFYFHDVYHNGNSNDTLECIGILFDAAINYKR